MKNVLIWFTNDLRVYDNPLLDFALSKSDDYIPVYIIPPYEINELSRQIPAGQLKREFRDKSLEQFAAQLKNLGKELIIREGEPEEVIPKIALKNECDGIIASRHFGGEYKRMFEGVERAMLKYGLFIDYFYNNFWIDIHDLPFPFNHTPNTFKAMLKEIRGINLQHKVSEIKPSSFADMKTLLSEIESSDMPELMPYKTNLNNHFSKFLPSLSIGRISPYLLFHEIAEKSTSILFGDKANDVLKTQLLKLDYIKMQYAALNNPQFDNDIPFTGVVLDKFKEWINGETENDFVNAIMHKLKTKGNISLTSKRYVILYYLKVLELPAFHGHWYFENQLTEYDPALNFMMWNEWNAANISGEEILEEISNQSEKLDPDFAFVSYWK